jgi:hypothetical protein
MADDTERLIVQLEAQEIWRRVPGFRTYSVSNMGRVCSLDHMIWGVRQKSHVLRSGRILRQSKQLGGYSTVNLSKKGHRITRLVHQLVLEAFIGPRPEGMQARHLDGCPTNNRLDNLVWGTSEQNNGEDKKKHGTLLLGEKNHQAKLTIDDVREIRKQRGQGVKLKALAASYGVSESMISKIALGHFWKEAA